MPKNLNFFAQNSWEKAVRFVSWKQVIKNFIYWDCHCISRFLKNDFKNERVIIESVIYQFRGLFE
jgi:hypothetical protein